MSAPRGVLIAFESISADGEDQGYHEVIVTLEDEDLDIRLTDGRLTDGATNLMVPLAAVEEAIVALKRWGRIRSLQGA